MEKTGINRTIRATESIPPSAGITSPIALYFLVSCESNTTWTTIAQIYTQGG